jgi:microsomal dipeptidase-like Zn-dependent dipeptidase
MSHFRVAAALMALSGSANATHAFYEGFENSAGVPNFFTGTKWHTHGAVVLPPAVPGDPTNWGWVPTFGENISVARLNLKVPGGMMNDIDPTDGVSNVVGPPMPLGAVLGGDYWNSAYPIGVVGEFFLGTGDVRPNAAAPWNLFGPVNTRDKADEQLTFDVYTAQPIPLNKNSSQYRYVSLLIGGTRSNSVFVSVEMEPKLDPATGAATGCTGKSLAPIAAAQNGPTIYFGQHGTYNTVRDKIEHFASDIPHASSEIHVPIGSDERMRLVILDLWGNAGMPGTVAINPRQDWCGNGRIRIVDRDPNGHLNVDEVMVSDLDEIGARYPGAPFGALTADRDPPVYGFADLHTHWMSHMGNGAHPLTSVTTPADRKSLRGLMTAMGSMSGRPFQPADTRIFDICEGVGQGPNIVVPFCPAVGDDGHAGPGTAAQSCNTTTGTCVVTAADREKLALAMCDGYTHSARTASGLFPNDWYGDAYYRPQESAGGILQGLDAGDGNVWNETIVEDTQHRFHGTTGFDAVTQTFVYPARPFMSKVHQQMYWTWVKRAWRGGLRLLVSDVVHSIPLDLILNEWWWVPLTEGNFQGIPIKPDDDLNFGHAADEQLALQRQTCAVKKLVASPEVREWAEVVFTPSQARDVIARGKLAIVLGAELDSAGSLRAGLNQADPAAAEIDFMQSLGIRKVTPIHQVDNKIGGPALFQPILTIYNDTLNLANDMLEGGNCISQLNFSRKFDAVNSPTHFNLNKMMFADVTPLSADKIGSNFFPDTYAHLGPGQVVCTFPYNPYRPTPNSDWCTTDNLSCWPGFNYFAMDLQLGSEPPGFSFSKQYTNLGIINDDSIYKRVGMDYMIVIDTQSGYIANFDDSPVQPADPKQRYWDASLLKKVGINNLGLSSTGNTYIKRLMSRGMLIDIEHMGEKSRDATMNVVWQTGTDNLPCDTAARRALSVCQKRAYPVLATHSQLRFIVDGESDERSWKTSEVNQIMQSGGLLGLHAGYDFARNAIRPKESGHDLTLGNDQNSACPGSSKPWLQQYLAYVQQGEGSGVRNFEANGAEVVRPPHWASAGGAIGSDFNGYADHVGSRFSPDAQNNCYGNLSGDKDTDKKFDPDLDSRQLGRAAAQVAASDGVFYSQGADHDAQFSHNPGPGMLAQPAMNPQVLASGVPIEVQGVTSDDEPGSDGFITAFFDYNKLGLAHIGLEPDLLQDAINPMRTNFGTFTEAQYQMRYLWRSAEDFLLAWEKSVAVCSANDPAHCMPPAPGAGTTDTCDLWASDLDGGGKMFDLMSQQGLPKAEANQPSCMDRCGQTLAFTEFSLVGSSIVPFQTSCRCWIAEDGENSPPSNICNDFKQWCQFAYNYSDGEGYLEYSSP